MSPPDAGSSADHPGAVSPRLDDVQSHEAKVVVGAESGTHGNGATIMEPLDAHGGITHRLQTALQMDVLAVVDGFGIAQWGDKHRLGLGDLLDVVLRLHERLVLQVLGLLVQAAVHARCVDTGTSYEQIGLALIS